jgi:glycosyltransferase involved in cell wall biosynthesis
MSVTLVATVLNEGESINGLMETIVSQSRRPDEVIICDGGSTDKTVEIIHQFTDRLPLRILVMQGANISRGRNEAIRAASGDIIAVTDAGVCLDPYWLERLVAPLDANPEVHVAAGFFQSDPRTPFEVALGATTLPEAKDINPESFLPSSRSVAFRRVVWEQVGGYPEWLDFCEDLILDFNLRAVAGAFAFAPDALARFRPRATLGAFVKQYYQYARGDGKANLWPRRHLIRYLTYFAALPLVLWLTAAVSPWWLVAMAAGGVYMVSDGYRRLPRQWGGLNVMGKLLAVLWVPVVRVAGDLAKMAGYPAGVAWRVRHHPPEWRVGVAPRAR